MTPLRLIGLVCCFTIYAVAATSLVVWSYRDNTFHDPVTLQQKNWHGLYGTDLVVNHRTRTIMRRAVMPVNWRLVEKDGRVVMITRTSTRGISSWREEVARPHQVQLFRHFFKQQA